MPPVIKNDKYVQAFGKHLRAIRKKKKMTMGNLGSASGMTLNDIHRYETGKVNITISSLLAIANALEIPPQKLLNFKFSGKF